MTSWRNGGGAAMLLAGSTMAAAAGAQVGNTVVPAPIAEPTASATLEPIPEAPPIVLPRVRTPRPRAAATPTPRPSETPTPQPTPTPEAAPSPQPTTAPAPVATTAPAATPAPLAPPPPAGGSGGWWPFAIAAGLLALAALGWVAARRRREAAGEVIEPVEAATPIIPPVPAAPPVSAAAVPAVPVAPRARLSLDFRPIRAGLNLLSATSENEIVLTNTGDAPAEDIRVLVRLVSAHGDQDAELAALYEAPVGRPTVPAFALQPGEQRVLSAVAALPRDAIRVLTAAGRPMFVPLVAVNATYATPGTAGQLAQAFAVGVEHAGAAKLAPFWLDVPPRSYDRVAARSHAAALER